MNFNHFFKYLQKRPKMMEKHETNRKKNIFILTTLESF